MKQITMRLLALCLLGILLTMSSVLFCAAQKVYPPSSYRLESGGRLIKWEGNETEIDFTKDEVLREIRYIMGQAFEGNSTLKSIVLPPALIEIWLEAFRGCTALEEIRFAEQEESYYVEELYLSLYDYCFAQCPKLQKVYLPKHLQTIEKGVFKGCSSLTEITINPRHPRWRIENRALVSRELPRTLTLFPPGITGDYTVHNQITNIGKGAFYSSNLASVYLPQSVETIEEDAFREAKSLKAINFPTKLRSIEAGAFSRCSSLATFIFPNTLETIGYAAFALCPRLPVTVKLPAQIVSLDGGAFCANPQLQAYSIDPYNPSYTVEEGVLFSADKTRLVSIPSGRKNYKLPEGVSRIESDAFRHSSIEKIDFSSDLREIGERAFWGCDSLKSISLPEGVTTLGKMSFYECNAVTKILLPHTVGEIGLYSFRRYAKDPATLPTREVVCHIPSPLDCSIWNDLQRDTLYVPEDAVELYKIAPGWKYFGTILPLKQEHVEKPQPAPYELSPDGSTLLHWYRGDKEIDFLADERLTHVRTIGAGAFAYNQNIERIILSPTTEIIASGAFEQCIHLAAIEAPSLLHVAEQAFSGCTALQTLTLTSIRSIEDDAFRLCSALYRVQLSDCIEQIGSYAFGGNSSLRELNVPCNIPPTLGENVFSDVPVGEVVLTVPLEAEESYRNAEQWKEFFSPLSSNHVIVKDNASPNVLYRDGYLHLTTSEVQKIEMYTLHGVRLFSQVPPLSDRIYIGQLPRGIYLIRIDTRLIRLLVQ